jgi:hypothetical protein
MGGLFYRHRLSICTVNRYFVITSSKTRWAEKLCSTNNSLTLLKHTNNTNLMKRIIIYQWYLYISIDLANPDIGLLPAFPSQKPTSPNHYIIFNLVNDTKRNIEYKTQLLPNKIPTLKTTMPENPLTLTDRVPKISRKVRTCTECRRQKIKCVVVQANAQKCTRCERIGLTCRFNKSLQTILEEDTE